MRALITSLLACTFLPITAAAQDTLDGAAFDAVVTGYTVTYNDGTGAYAGVEAYHPNGRVTWVSPGGVCQKGTWYQSGPDICFLYQGSDLPVCWQFYHDGTTLTATRRPGDPPWTATDLTTDPIACTSPFLGS